jgi:hypothetical protein
MLPFAASQYFHERGGALLFSDTGNLKLALTATAHVFAWGMFGFSPDAPGVTGTAGSRYFLSSATAGTKYLAKPLTGSEIFVMPGDDSFVSATHRGLDCDLVSVNDGTQQVADIGTTSTNILRIIGGGNDDGGLATDILVMINPIKLQLAVS